MEEGDPPAVEPDARRLVDQLNATRGQVGERPVEIVYQISNVVHARAARRQKTAEPGIVVERAEQLNPVAASFDRDGVDVLLFDPNALVDDEPKPPVGIHGGVQIVNNYTDMMNWTRRCKRRV